MGGRGASSGASAGLTELKKMLAKLEYGDVFGIRGDDNLYSTGDMILHNSYEWDYLNDRSGDYEMDGISTTIVDMDWADHPKYDESEKNLDNLVKAAVEAYEFNLENYDYKNRYLVVGEISNDYDRANDPGEFIISAPRVVFKF